MDKASFLIYLDYEEQFNLLTDEQAGQLIKAIIKYEKNGEIVELDKVTKMAFSFIKQQLDRDKEKWQEEKKKRSEAGKKGMNNRWNKGLNTQKEDTNITNDNSVINVNNKNNSVKSVITRNNKNKL